MRREAVEASLSTLPSNSFDTHLTSQPKSQEYFRSAITAKRKKPRAAPYPKKKPIPAVPKETKYSPSPKLRLIDCGLVLYKGKKPANDPLLFNIKQTVNIKNPNLFEELKRQLLVKFTPEILECISLEQLPRDVEQNLSLLHGKSHLTDLDALLFVVHKSTDKKPVQVDLAYQYRSKEKKTDPIEDDDSEITEVQTRKKTSTQTKSQKIPSDLEDDDSEISEVQTRKKTSAQTKSQKIPSNLEDDNLEISEVLTRKKTSARLKSQKIPSDLEDDDSEISEVQPRKKTSAQTKLQKIPSNYESSDSDQSTLPTQLVAKSKNTAMLSDQELQEYPSHETEVPRSKTTGSKPQPRKLAVLNESNVRPCGQRTSASNDPDEITSKIPTSRAITHNLAPNRVRPRKGVAHNKPDTWASSGVACTVPARGAASLSTQIGYLG
ncbi:Eukaryotic elongation factor-2 kinase [Puccinia graminis f. sp. tritici]|uniref:Eukaryotic elongation factor-2 kinase n=1 Tax=Puccinia graminis f. sp. tritici TaxID=56615 RepID=A0A5B0NTR5_PUCGR|nr:Eukaryotic elongation factor-2 kinase [Puccinia graminis f. sp. tritici]